MNSIPGGSQISKWASALKNSIVGPEEKSNDNKGTDYSNTTKSSAKSEPRKQSSGKRNKFKFWKKSSNKAPGSIRQVRAFGAQHPPLTLNHTNLQLQSTGSQDTGVSQTSSTTERSPNVNQTEATSIQLNLEKTSTSSLPLVAIQTPTASNNSNSKIPDEEILTSPVTKRSSASSNIESKTKNRRLQNLMMNDFRSTCWHGIPDEQRPHCWRLLLGYMPRNAKRRSHVLEKRRKEYLEIVRKYWDIPEQSRTGGEMDQLRQINQDIPRTHGQIKWFHFDFIQDALRRMLFIWALRHPASGYVQGMNDLVSIFFLLFMDEHVRLHSHCKIESAFTSEATAFIETKLSSDQLSEIEADSFWCLSALLDGIQDSYTPDQPGIQRMIFRFEEIVQRIDLDLFTHLQNCGVMTNMYAFRWMNCLLVRELPVQLVFRLWDTYLCEGESIKRGFTNFHVYVCASFLCRFSKTLCAMEMENMSTLQFLQGLPNRTSTYSNREIEEILSQAYQWHTMFKGAESHFL